VKYDKVVITLINGSFVEIELMSRRIASRGYEIIRNFGVNADMSYEFEKLIEKCIIESSKTERKDRIKELEEELKILYIEETKNS
jgi:hypothetical protein